MYEVSPEEADKLASTEGTVSKGPDFKYLDNFYKNHPEVAHLSNAYSDHFFERHSEFQDWVETWYYDQTDDGAPSVEEYIEDLLNRDSDDPQRKYREVRYYIMILEEKLNLDIPFGDFDL